MMRTLYSGMSGLLSHQTRMDVVGNNISNVNTVGFKSGRTVFADMLSQNMKNASAPSGTLGGTNPLQIGLGTKVEGIDTIFNDGSPLVTGKNTDLCLTGDGLFMVKRGNETYYTRNGAFEFDAAGNYVMPGSGHYVQGWMATDGVIDTTAEVGNITAAVGQVMPAQATTNVDFKYNLSADEPLVKELTGGTLYETVQKVAKTQTHWEEVGPIDILEEVESLYNLNVKIGGNDYILHVVGNRGGHEEDIDLSKHWKVKEVVGEVTGRIETYDPNVILEDEDGNTAGINVLSKGTNNIKVGDAFSADTSLLRFRSTVNEKSPLPFSVNGIQCNAIRMPDHSVEIPGEYWYVERINSNKVITIVQKPNGVPNGCAVTIELDHELSASEAASIKGGKLEFAGEAYTATRYRPVTVTTYEDVVTVHDGTYKYYNSMPVEQTVSVYDSLGRSYQIPVYFVAEGEAVDGGVKRTDKWLVSLEKNAAVKKGETTTYEFLDADGNKATATMPAAEIQFDAYGNLITDGESDNTAPLFVAFTIISLVCPWR